MIFNGQKFEESLFDLSDVPNLRVDLGVFVIGWESRSKKLIESGSIGGKRCLVFSFREDGILTEEREDYYRAARQTFETVVPIELPPAYNRVEWQSEIEKLFKNEVNLSGDTCFVDYTSLPKAVAQTLYRFLLVDQSFCRSFWGYLEGIYPRKYLGSNYSQGIREPFFPIRHTPGTGGMSEKQALIVSIGADEHVIFDLLETRSYDLVAAMYSNSNLSPDLGDSRRSILARLSREYGLSEDLTLESSAFSVNDSINSYVSLIKKIPREYSVDIFCCGTKSHAVAACAVAERFKKTVSILGRIPTKYGRNDIVASGKGSIATVTDFTNPRIGNLLKG